MPNPVRATTRYGRVQGMSLAMARSRPAPRDDLARPGWMTALQHAGVYLSFLGLAAVYTWPLATNLGAPPPAERRSPPVQLGAPHDIRESHDPARAPVPRQCLLPVRQHAVLRRAPARSRARGRTAPCVDRQPRARVQRHAPPVLGALGLGDVLGGVARHRVSHRAAFLAGMIFTFAPYRIDHYMEFQMEMAFGIPLAIYMLVRFLETQRARYLVALVAPSGSRRPRSGTTRSSSRSGSAPWSPSSWRSAGPGGAPARFSPRPSAGSPCSARSFPWRRPTSSPARSSASSGASPTRSRGPRISARSSRREPTGSTASSPWSAPGRRPCSSGWRGSGSARRRVGLAPLTRTSRAGAWIARSGGSRPGC